MFRRGRTAADMKGYVYVCGKFVKTDLAFDDLRDEGLVMAELKRAVEKCIGAELISARFELMGWTMSADWVVLEYVVGRGRSASRVHLVFAKGSPAKALEKAKETLWGIGPWGP